MILSLSDIFHMDWPGHVPFLPSFVWLLLKSELIMKLYRWFHCFSDAFSSLHYYYFWLLVGFSHVMESLPLFSDFSPWVFSIPNSWSIYLAMPNILLPSLLPRLPCHGVQPWQREFRPGQEFPTPLTPASERDWGKSISQRLDFHQTILHDFFLSLEENFDTLILHPKTSISRCTFPSFLLGFLSANVRTLYTLASSTVCLTQQMPPTQH